MRLQLPAVALAALCLAACEKKSEAPRPVETKPVAATAPAPEARPAEDVILLGEVGSLTGSEAAFGKSTRDGVELALEEVNAAGGLLGKKVAVRVYDDQSKPEEAASATKRLLTQDKVVVVLGEVASSNSLAMAPIAQDAKIPMISPSSTNPRVTEVGDYIFRVCFIDPFQGFVMAKYAHDDLKYTRVAILTDKKSAYSEGLTEVFQRKFTEMGGKIAGVEAYAKGDTDFRAQLTKVKAARPTGLYLPGYYQDVAAIAEQARELGLGARLLGSDGWSAPKLLELAGGALEGAVMTDSYAADDPAPASRAFIERFTARYGHPPNGNAALGYDAARLVLDAAGRATALDGPSLRDALAATRDFPGAAGTLTFDAGRNPVKPVVLVGIEKGAFRYQATVAP